MKYNSKCYYGLPGVIVLLISSLGYSQSANIMVQADEAGTDRIVTEEGKQKDLAVDLHPYSAYTIIIQEPPAYVKHDHIQIIVRETSTIKSKQELSTAKDWGTKGEIKDFPQLTLNDFLNGLLKASENAYPPKLDISTSREFDGTGEYKRSDDFTARVMAEVIQILPNGQLVLEARTQIVQDDEEATLLLSGVCDPLYITPSRTVQSSQLFDLRVIKQHEGELKKTNEKGFITKALEAIFAF